MTDPRINNAAAFIVAGLEILLTHLEHSGVEHSTVQEGISKE
jgi:hypothetical protein